MRAHAHMWEPPSATCEEQTLLDHSSRTEQRARECLSPCTCRAGRRKQSQSEARFYESTNQCRLTEHHNHPTWSRTLRGFNGSEHPVYPGISIKPPRLALKAPCTPPPPIALAGSVSSVGSADQLRPASPGSALPLLHPRLLGLTHASLLLSHSSKPLLRGGLPDSEPRTQGGRPLYLLSFSAVLCLTNTPLCCVCSQGARGATSSTRQGLRLASSLPCP